MKQQSTKLRSVAKLADPNGFFKIVAIDHRDVYAAMFKERTGVTPDFSQLVQSKREIVNALSEHASSFLFDPIYCLPDLVLDGSIGECGFIVSIEGNDYSTKYFDENYLLKDINVQKIKEMGGSAVKLFLYYNPTLPLSESQNELISQVSQQCMQFKIPFLLEPILYFEGSPPPLKQQVEITKMMLDKLSQFGIDVFKIVFPGDILKLSDKENMDICLYVTQNLQKPWIILSSGIDEEAFIRQLTIACKCGASGFAIGRTLWGGCVGLSKEKGQENYKKMLSFFERVSLVTNMHATDWKNKYCT